MNIEGANKVHRVCIDKLIELVENPVIRNELADINSKMQNRSHTYDVSNLLHLAYGDGMMQHRYAARAIYSQLDSGHVTSSFRYLSYFHGETISEDQIIADIINEFTDLEKIIYDIS